MRWDRSSISRKRSIDEAPTNDVSFRVTNRPFSGLIYVSDPKTAINQRKLRINAETWNSRPEYRLVLFAVRIDDEIYPAVSRPSSFSPRIHQYVEGSDFICKLNFRVKAGIPIFRRSISYTCTRMPNRFHTHRFPPLYDPTIFIRIRRNNRGFVRKKGKLYLMVTTTCRLLRTVFT